MAALFKDEDMVINFKANTKELDVAKELISVLTSELDDVKIKISDIKKEITDIHFSSKSEKHLELERCMLDYCINVLKKEEPSGTELLLFPEVLKGLITLSRVSF